MSDEETGATAVADELVPAELQETHAIVVASEDFRQFANGMLEMYREAHGVVFDLTRTRDNDAARALRKRLVSTRTAVEKRRTEGNRADRESVADRIARRDQLAATLTDIVRGLEEPIDAAIRADEARREREAEERRLAEEKRITELRQRVDDITGVAVRAVGMASAEIEAKLSLVGRIEIDDSYQEMQEAAHHAKANTILRLNELLTTARQQEAERAEAERNRVELEQLRAAQAQRDREEAAAREAREREEAAAREREEEARKLRQRQGQAAQDAVAAIQAKQRGALTATVAGIEALITAVKAIAPAIDCGDFAGQWTYARDLAIEQLQELHGQKLEQERQAEVLRAEAARARQIRGAIETIKSYHTAYTGEPEEAEAIAQAMVALQAIAVDEATFGDMMVVASAVKEAAMTELGRLLVLARAPRQEPEPEPVAPKASEPAPQASEPTRATEETPRDDDALSADAAPEMEPQQMYFGLLDLCARIARDAERTPAATKRGGPWSVPAPLIQELRDTLPKVPMPGGQFYSPDGTLMNANGSRSIFDDVDQ